LLADPSLIRAEIDRRLDQLRTADPTTAQQQRLDQALTKASAAITRLIKAYQEELISLDELRERIPELRSRETSLRSQLAALTAQLIDRQAYLQLATGLEDFLAQLRTNAGTATIPQRQRVLRLLVKDVLIGPERILIRHSIPTRTDTTTATKNNAEDDHDEEPSPSCPLRWRSRDATLRGARLGILVIPSSDKTPDFRNALTSASTRLSAIRSRTRASSAGWEISSKHAVMSPSNTHS
jgi:site-specific DNA recombinase